MDTKPISLLLVDDQVLFREAMRTLLSLEPSLNVVAEASHGEEAVRMAAEHQPQVVLMDLSMPVMSGSEATRRLRAANPEVRVLVLTTFDDEEGVFDALRSGASGYLLKNTPVAQLVTAIRTVAEGGTYLQPSVATQVVAELNRLSQRPNSDAAHRVMSLLSLREMEILRHLTRGMSNKEIAAALNITEGTVKNHMTSIFDKLEVPDRTSAALKARELNLG
ncbi:MAG: response regulator transcription factor [Prosthecobacter sp.]|jgi:DNA-binding NarL/FixJ family response regulator|uniref:response regulator n=1 Tax=Prosthecobacter sp. TaxID=1965333 RepID=UPI0019DC110E|nr:response regulator transcription factor [Prosthecobacter sp.]MBE2287607.1 response regulator transcription factor [Prosthecobacter sp.]